MTEQTNAELIAEAKTYVTDEYITPDTSPEESLIRRLAAALQAAEQRAAEYAAVVEKVRTVIHGPSGLSINEEKVWQIVNSATAPDDALREVKADVWDEAIDSACEQGTIQLPDNPYREEQS